jgi:hypothetical protein
MSYDARQADYCYIMTTARAGTGAKILGALKDAGINLLAFSGFPAGKGRAQIDLVADSLDPIYALAKDHKWKLSKPKKCFLVQGTDEIGAIEGPISALANAGIKITAADAVAAGAGRYGMLLWVKPKNHKQAAAVLGAA